MEKRIVTNYERGLTTTVNDIEHIESQTLTGLSIVKIFFQPGARIEAATAQVTAISQTVLRQMPPGTTPPFIIRYSASNVPFIQPPSRVIRSRNNNSSTTGPISFDRHRHHPGRPAPLAVRRQAAPNHDRRRPTAPLGVGLSPRDVINAVAVQNVILPTGTVKMGANEYPVLMNSSPELFKEIGDLPIKNVGATTVYVRDVANVRDGYAPQTNMVHVQGHESVLMSILKNGNVSTLDIAARLRQMLPSITPSSPRISRSRFSSTSRSSCAPRFPASSKRPASPRGSPRL